MVKEVFAIDTYWMREIGFHQCSGTGYINHTSRRALCSGVVDRHKMVSMLCFLLLLDFFFGSYLVLVF